MPRHFPDWIEAYLSLVRGRTEAPESFHLWSAVATIGAAVTRHCYIDEVAYRFYPNWMIVLAALPGRAKKSTTVDLCMKLLRDIHPELFGPDETTWPDICRTFAERTQHQIISDDPTADPLTADYDTQCAVTFALREFGTFLKGDDDHAIDGITQLWDCADRPFIKSTKDNGVDNIVNPFFNVIGCATAKWLKDRFAVYQGWGIASRIIFVHSDASAAPIWSPSRLIRRGEWDLFRSHLTDDLEHITTLHGECRFSPAAALLAESWYEGTMRHLETYSKRLDADMWVCDFLARKQVHVHKLAMTLSLARRDTLIVDEVDYREAIEHLGNVEKELLRVFKSSLSPTEGAINERTLYERIHAELSNGLGGSANKTYLLNRISTFVDGYSAERILSSFLRRGLFTEEQTRGGTLIRLPETAVEYTGGHHH